MAANAQSQNRCVFVGNIPYDATEEQLIKICEEVGPVVSFRLVTDRETGKPKGYGFCEYKDEETALSARRNLASYDINGRQLIVDFAENDKNADRNREQFSRHSASCMDAEKRPEHSSFLDTLPPVEFACIYGSSLHPNNHDKTSMVDYILGVADPQKWHAENMELNRNHYASWMVHLGGARLITGVADHIGVRVHFNPFIAHRDRMFKYGVVRMNDLIQDIQGWERFYLSGRLQKPVNVILDNLEIEKLNSVNVKAAASAALLLLPSKFSEEELYAKICSLSYMGDLRMLFAEDKHKVKKIVQGQFKLFQKMYNPFLEEFAAQDLLRISSPADQKVNFIQDCGLSTTYSLVSSLPLPLRCHIGMKPSEKKAISESGRAVEKVAIKREEAADCIQKTLRRKVMVSSARQAAAGLLTVGGVHGAKYVGSKMNKAWRSWW